jgi:hypothetical protein
MAPSPAIADTDYCRRGYFHFQHCRLPTFGDTALGFLRGCGARHQIFRQFGQHVCRLWSKETNRSSGREATAMLPEQWEFSDGAMPANRFERP